jgi:HEAT repeats/Scaffold protein Nfu/NifU N terminal
VTLPVVFDSETGLPSCGWGDASDENVADTDADVGGWRSGTTFTVQALAAVAEPETVVAAFALVIDNGETASSAERTPTPNSRAQPGGTAGRILIVEPPPLVPTAGCHPWPLPENLPAPMGNRQRMFSPIKRPNAAAAYPYLMPSSERDQARHQVAARGLTPAAAAHLTRDALGTIDLAALAPVKTLLKRFFSDEPWTTADDNALAELVGTGEGWWYHDLDDELTLEFGWRAGVFRMDVAPRHPGDTFAGPVVPEATPNPRTIRFLTPLIHEGPSRWYESAAGVDDPRVARLFTEFDDVANVLVGPSFVAVGLQHPDRWEQLLDPMLRSITNEFASTAAELDPVRPAGAAQTAVSPESRTRDAREGNALERAWKELGTLRAADPAQLERILGAAESSESAARQVAARLLVDATGDVAERAWSLLLDDPSRSVRRAAVDAMVDAERPALRPLLERALSDADAWTRWKALRGLVDLGVDPSHAAVAGLADDPDFRVRLEASRALAGLEHG